MVGQIPRIYMLQFAYSQLSQISVCGRWSSKVIGEKNE